MPTKSFRGKIADTDVDTISLHTNTGATGYRITKFQIIPEDPGANNGEHTVQIFKIPQASPFTATTVDFSDNTLLGLSLIQL